MKPVFSDFMPQGSEIPSIQKQIEENRLVHAVLITGQTGTGKRTLANLIAASLLCHSGSNKPCGCCNSCLMVSHSEHPDLIVVDKDIAPNGEIRKNKSSIPIDDIRAVIHLTSTYPFEGGNRVVIIRNAEDMTVQAQNCLLKILEEPPGNTFFILLSAHDDQLLSTVRSRCRTVRLKPWDADYIEKILVAEGTDPKKAHDSALASHGSIGYAFKLSSDDDYWKSRQEIIDSFLGISDRSQILSVSAKWKDRKQDADLIFSILEDCIQNMIYIRINNSFTNSIDNFPKEWLLFSREAAYERFTFLLDRVRDARMQNAFNVNFQAIIEQLLLAFIGEVEVWRK